MRLFKKRNLLTILLFFLTSSILIACSGKDEGSSKSSSGKGDDEEIVLDFWYRLGGSYQDILQDSIDEFVKDNPNVRIEVNDIPPDQYGSAVQTAATANDLPDMFLMHSSFTLKSLVDQDLLLELDDVLTPEVKEQYEPGTWVEGNKVLDGKTYSLPLRAAVMDIPVLFYNKDILAEAGHTEDLPLNLSWEEFINISRDVKEKTDKTPATISESAFWIMTTHLFTMANAIYPDATASFENEAIFNYKEGILEQNNPGLVETFEFFKSLSDEGLLYTNWLTADAAEAREMFTAGKAAFAFQNSENAAGIKRYMEEEGHIENVGVVYMPTKNGDPYYAPVDGDSQVNVLVPKTSEEHKDIIFEFLELLRVKYPADQLELGVNRSPIAEQNETIKSDNELFNKVNEMRGDAAYLVPNFGNRNIKAIDVLMEFEQNRPPLSWWDIFSGYVAGEVPDLQAELDKHNEEWNKAFQQAIEHTDGITQEDFMYDDWEPFVDYEE